MSMIVMATEIVMVKRRLSVSFVMIVGDITISSQMTGHGSFDGNLPTSRVRRIFQLLLTSRTRTNLLPIARKWVVSLLDWQAYMKFIVCFFQSLNTASESYKKIYWFSWKCFQVWEQCLLYSTNLLLSSSKHVWERVVFKHPFTGSRRRQGRSSFELWVPDDDLDCDGRPEASRAARPVPAGGGEGEDLCQDGRKRGRVHCIQRVARLLPSGG